MMGYEGLSGQMCSRGLEGFRSKDTGKEPKGVQLRVARLLKKAGPVEHSIER